MEDLIARLKAANADIERRDTALRDELNERRESESFVSESLTDRDREIAIEGQTVDRQDFVAETIVLRTGRPVLAIVRDKARLIFDDPESRVWKDRLQKAQAHLVRAAQAVGRIEVEGHSLEWLGTGWLVRPDVVVTNRHVAAEFGRRNGTSFVFRQGLTGRKMAASIDFIEEFGRQDSLTFRLEEILHIEDADGPDLAFLRATPLAGMTLAPPIKLAATRVPENEMIAVIGYPARDSRIPDQPLMDKIFGSVFDKKRLAPGQITRSDRETIRHDCSTLGGNSGSVVVSLKTGEAVGIHFAGRFLLANFAVPSTILGERLDDVSNGTIRRRPGMRPSENTTDPTPVKQAAPSTSRAISYVVPLRVTVELGDPYTDGGHATIGQYAPPSAPGDPRDDERDVFTEAVVADFRDRKGYLTNFLGADAEVPLPDFTANQSDVLTFTIDGETDHVLRYEHFSVAMSKSRRLCRYSAVNIDGKREKSKKRVGWRTDPRIPLTAQIKGECYGDEPKFARGHMTRREDPIWGTDTAATKGNADSMHVTNAVPQMQPFNAGIWLELENFALQNARKDDMKISVFTGPFLTSSDPVMFGVKIPIEFWKVIAFIHDETGELCATGYTMSQEDFLSEDEFVFGKHKTNQRAIREIEERTGLSFGPLADLDPFEDEEGLGGELTDLEQIRFIKRR